MKGEVVPNRVAPPRPPIWPDGTVRLPNALESWLDSHYDGEKGDDGDDLEQARNVTAVALWSLLYRQGHPDTDQAALDAIYDLSQPQMTHDKASFDAGYEAGFKFGLRARQRARELAEERAQSEGGDFDGPGDSVKRRLGAHADAESTP